MMARTGRFAGTLTLARLALRRDRIQLPVWLAGLGAIAAATASSIAGLYDTPREQVAYAAANAKSVVSRVFNGAIAEPGRGAIVMVEMFSILAVLAALMSAFAVVRHTRQNEETGRAEMIGAGAVGRHAGLTSALIVAVGANAVLAALLALVLMANDLPVAGSLAAGSAVGAVGVAFAGVAAVTAQVSEGARGANGLAAAAIGLAFLLRGAGDGFGDVEANGVEVASGWPSWLSLIGWGQQIRPYHDNDWRVLGLYAALFAALVGAAFVLTGHRDLGAGMMPVRPGPAAAARGLLSPLGLAWRLQRGVLFGWAAGTVIMGVALGAVGNEVEEVFGSSEQLAEIIGRLGGGGGLTDVYFSAMMGIFGVVIAGYTLQALLRMRAEETGPLESVLAASVARPRWMLSHIVCAALGTLTLLLLTGLSAGLAYAAAAGSLTVVPDLIVAALAQAPAVFALAGLAVALLGLLPRWAAALSWTALTGCLLIGQPGPILELPQPVMNISPFSHTPPLPSAGVTVTPLVALLLIAAVLALAGLGFFRRRDLSF
jgi:ABC-2 type transport system permease protein